MTTIVETITTTRANTSIDWNDLASSLPEEENLWHQSSSNGSMSVTYSVSQDELTKIETKIWNNTEAFIACRCFVDNTVSTFDYWTNKVKSGLTITRQMSVY